MCSVQHAGADCYPAYVQPEQRIIADWIERTAKRLGWTYGRWAEEAKLGAATTITRALKDDYQSITSIKTLKALAEAAGEPSVLDFLAGGTTVDQPPQIVTPSAESLSMLLGAVLPLLPPGRQSARSLRVASAALAHGLELLGDQSANPDGEAGVGVAARAAVSRFRDLTQQ
jgi:hypothetical protein